MNVPVSLNPNMQVNVHHYGEEKLPLLVIDDFLQDAEQLVEHASQQQFKHNSSFYPGIRAVAPKEFQLLLLSTLGRKFKEVFELQGNKLSFSICHYSLVTTLPQQLKLLQRIPHFDAVETQALASVFYLFDDKQGGTAFYRHRKTGYEYIDESRRIEYFQSLESENGTDNIPKPSDGYINGDTALFEQIHRQPGVFNRMIVYRRNCLHSGVIPNHCNFSSDPRTGRLSISSFIDTHQ